MICLPTKKEMEHKEELLVKSVEKRLTEILSPSEALIMKLQSLFVWEYPVKSAVLIVVIHLLLWLVWTYCIQVYTVVSICLLGAVLLDTWQTRFFSEVRVPSSELDDDGWTPVHPQLMSVPDISRCLSVAICKTTLAGGWSRALHREKPFTFFILFSLLFTMLAILGTVVSGFTMVYGTAHVPHPLLIMCSVCMMSLLISHWMILPKKATALILKVKQHGRPSLLAKVIEETEDEYEPFLDQQASDALTDAICDDSSDDGTDSTSPSIASLSKELFIDNSIDDSQTDDFSLNVEDMPSFDDIEHSDDDIPMPLGMSPDDKDNDPFLPSNLDDSDSEDDANAGTFLDMSQVAFPRDHGSASLLTSSLVTKTLSTIMESALQGVMGMSSGRKVQSTSRLGRSGTKMVYTKTSDGESFDMRMPEPTIAEDDEGGESGTHTSRRGAKRHANNDVAEIERDFDFLEDFVQGSSSATH